jgi:hypothetical protein
VCESATALELGTRDLRGGWKPSQNTRGFTERAELRHLVWGLEAVKVPMIVDYEARQRRLVESFIAINQCPPCKRPTHSKELVSFKGRKLCLYCVELQNRNERLRQEAQNVTHRLAGAIRDLAFRLDSHGCL